MTDKKIRYEENAEYLKNIKGWICKTCLRYFGNGEAAEHLAALCCATDLPCECGGRNLENGCARCAECREKQEKEQWEKMEVKEWDGKTPIYSHALDRYYFDGLENIYEDADEHKLTLEGMELVLCQPVKKPTFSVYNLLDGYIDDDCDVRDINGYADIKQAVHDWIDENVPAMSEASKFRVNLSKIEGIE